MEDQLKAKVLELLLRAHSIEYMNSMGIGRAYRINKSSLIVDLGDRLEATVHLFYGGIKIGLIHTRRAKKEIMEVLDRRIHELHDSRVAELTKEFLESKGE